MATTPVFKMVPPWVPELLPSVQAEIETFLASRGLPFVLEVGSGWSTVWFAQRAGLVHSLEDDQDWYGEVLRALDDNYDGTNAWRVEHVKNPKDMPKEVARMECEYDLVLIDGGPDDTRLASLFASLTKVVDVGWIVLDDAHWSQFKYVPNVMEEMGYKCKRLQGQHTRKTGEVCFHCTDIYCKEFR